MLWIPSSDEDYSDSASVVILSEPGAKRFLGKWQGGHWAKNPQCLKRGTKWIYNTCETHLDRQGKTPWEHGQCASCEVHGL